MIQEFDEKARIHCTRDAEGNARDILHIEEQYESTAGTALLAAHEYLVTYGSVLGISPAELANFSMPPENSPSHAGVEYRFAQEKPQFDMTTVVLGQTYFGLPVWEAGIAVHMRQRPFVVMSAQSTRHFDVSAEMPSEKALARIRKIDAQALIRPLGITGDKDCDAASLSIQRQRLVVYRYDEAKRMPEEEHPSVESEGQEQHGLHPSLSLARQGAGIRDGQHYVAAEITFTLPWQGIKDLSWVAIVDVETLFVLYLRAFIDDVTGLVFKEDPITANGGPLPNATAAALNAVRSSVLLPDLSPPLGGTYALTGDRVRVVDVEVPNVAPPTEPVGTNFDFASRTNDFAAVNAYYHCDRFFLLVQELGFDLATYFTGTIFPTTVDHRGRFGTATGLEINAYCLGNGSFGIQRTAFMLADLTDVVNPIGLACDWRVVLHELGGHGILYNHVNSANFGFAHSAGDSFGAVLNDPGTRAADRFQTFPWVNSVIGRRHDRDVTTGWAWGGVNDFGGYSSEQILCTTHFRLYRSIGGDSAEIAMSKFAARYVAYLILRTVGSLTQATNPSNPTSYALALIAAEFGNWTSEDQVGSVYWKVIRWAFEKQGLFQLAGAPTPVVSEGAPPPVDLFIDDGRNGEYAYLEKFWESRDIWNRHEPDGQHEHQTPIVCKKNYAYVRIKNRGTQPASGARVWAYHCRPSAGLVWPDDFESMTTVWLSVPGTLAAGAEIVIGPFEWTPVHEGHECMLMSVTAPADRANNDRATGFPSAIGPTPAWRLVPCDNNIAMRCLIPVPGSGRCALEAAFCNRKFWAQNPTAKTARMEVRAVLPGFLTVRGWAMRFDNPGGGSFSVGSRESRLIRPKLISGQDFSASDVTNAGEVTITVLVLADGLVVGGLTYLLDPALAAPARERRNVDECKAEREHGKKCCCEPCIDDRCKDHHLCCPEHKSAQECAPEPCDKPNRPFEHECNPCEEHREHVCCEEGGHWPQRIRLELDIEPHRHPWVCSAYKWIGHVRPVWHGWAKWMPFR